MNLPLFVERGLIFMSTYSDFDVTTGSEKLKSSGQSPLKVVECRSVAAEWLCQVV